MVVMAAARYGTPAVRSVGLALLLFATTLRARLCNQIISMCVCNVPHLRRAPSLSLRQSATISPPLATVHAAWLSVSPNEKEALYPPLTYLRAIKAEKRRSAA